MPPPVKRDSLSPATGASQLQRVPSRESLNAHPLLSPNSPSSSVSMSTTQDSSTTTPPRYVPYTPRHRPPASSATTSMTAHAPMPVPSHKPQEGGATSKLQLQNLKAAAQGIGLGNGTVGWAMLEKLVDGETGGEWDEIWTILTTAKPTLLLPLEPFSGELITPELIKDHLAFCYSPASSSSPLVTLSGLRGTINNSVLTFRSTLPLSSRAFLDLSKPEFQAAALMSLPPLPSTPATAANTPLPSFALPASTSLPLPPRTHAAKPPLPPRPGNSSSPQKLQGASRITNPFASLFGRPPASASSNLLSTSPSQSPLQSEETLPMGSVDVAAFSLGKKITKKSVGRELSKVIKEEIKAGLAGCPTWVVDRVVDFTGPLHPVPRTSKRIEIRHNTSAAARSRPRAPSVLPPATQLPDPSSLADAFQAFYASMEDDLRASGLNSPFGGWKKSEKRVVSQSSDELSVTERESSEDGKDDEPREKEETSSETKINDVLERVENVICTVFYDRTFRPLAGDDVSHDDALANRIAALSLLDLGLEHLGVEIPNEAAKSGVEDLVKSCGESLQRLEDSQHRSPREKSSLLIEAHKKIVDGLSRLPKLRLKPENDFEQEQDQKTPRASSFGKEAAQEAMKDLSTSSPVPSAEPESNGDLAVASIEAAPEDVTPQSEGKPTPELSDASSQNTLTETITQSPADIPPDGSSSALPLPQSPTSESAPQPSSPTPVSGDLLFPLLIFSVVKANPANLVSHLLYTQRFRSRSVGGQESYCLINLMAVVEFLENVDMGALGLGDSERVMSTADLTPIPLAHGSIDTSTSPPSPLTSRLGKRMNQQVEELAGLAGSANKVITGVVDSSFGVLRGFLSSNPDLTTPHGEMQDDAPWNNIRPGFGLLRRGSGFAIASVAASLPGAGRPKTPGGGAGEEGQQLMEVSSRPGSLKEAEREDEDEDDETTGSSGEEDESPEGDAPERGDARSVRSFSSMMSRESRDRERERERAEGRERKSLTDRLASMSRLGSSPAPAEQSAAALKTSPPPSRPTSRPTSWLAPVTQATQPADTPASSRTSSPSHPKLRIPPPNRRFLECAEQDIRVGEVGDLLREYRRMAQALHAAGIFEDHA